MGPVGLWATRSVVHQIHRAGRVAVVTRPGPRLGAGGAGGKLARRLGPLKMASRAVGVVVDPDPGAHQVRAQRRGRDLQLAAAPGDAVVVADDALLLDREDVAPERLGDHHEGRGRLLGRDREGPLCSGR